MTGEEKYHIREFKKMVDANALYNSLKIKENCTAKIQLHDLDIVPDTKEENGLRVRGKTDLDADKIVATVVKMGYYEQRDE